MNRAEHGKVRPTVAGVLLLLSLIASGADATSEFMGNLEALVSDSDVIAQVRCTSILSSPQSANSHFTKASVCLQVEGLPFIGTCEESITLDFPLGTDLPWSPAILFQVGSHYVIALRGDGAHAPYKLVGGKLGVFTISRNPEGEETLFSPILETKKNKRDLKMENERLIDFEYLVRSIRKSKRDVPHD